MSEDKRRSRSFKVKEDTDDKSYGRYTGESPYQAANKALSELIRKRNKDGKGTGGKINFTLIESTKGSKHREHEYVGVDPKHGLKQHWESDMCFRVRRRRLLQTV